jgi:hypothetical protein
MILFYIQGLYARCDYEKKSLSHDGQQFHQYQQPQLLPQNH